MRISDRYIGRQVLTSTVFAVIVLSAVLVLGSLFQQIRPLLVDQGIPFMLVVRFALNILPFSLMFTIPWGFLSAVLLVFGRLSAEQELTGFRVAGISLPRLAVPVFMISLLLCGVGMFLNVEVGPRAKASLDTMIYQELMKDPRSLLDPGAVQSRFSNQKVFVEGREPGGALLGFHLYNVQPKGDAKPGDATPPPPPAYVHAGRVEVSLDDQKQKLKLTLDNAYIESPKPTGTAIAITDEAKYWFLDFADSQKKKPRAGVMTSDEIHEFIKGLDPRLKANERVAVNFRAEITKRYSYSMACLAFAFVGVPLALKSRRQDTSGGIMLSMLIAAAYFLFSFVAEQMHSDRGVTIALWTPNVLCVILGLFLFRRARFR